jgi:predicted Zn-dependent peptidase
MFAIMAGVLSASEARSAGPDVSHFTLANGLEVVVVPDHRSPAVTHMVWYKVGAADETPGKSGLAHYLEHLMFKGTKRNPFGLSRGLWRASAATKTLSPPATTRRITSGFLVTSSGL